MTVQVTTIRDTIHLAATPKQVYEAYLDADIHSTFTESPATSDPKVGGKFTAWDGYISGTFLELEPGRRIVQAWQTTEWPAGYPPSRVAFLLEPEGKGTKLTMIHSEVPQSQVEDYRQGWIDFYWTPLQAYFSSDASGTD